MIDVTFELAPIVGLVFCDFAFRLIPVQASTARPVKRSEELVAMAVRAFLDSGTPAEVLAS